jgi:hypothetical protein
VIFENLTDTNGVAPLYVIFKLPVKFYVCGLYIIYSWEYSFLVSATNLDTEKLPDCEDHMSGVAEMPHVVEHNSTVLSTTGSTALPVALLRTCLIFPSDTQLSYS